MGNDNIDVIRAWDTKADIGTTLRNGMFGATTDTDELAIKRKSDGQMFYLPMTDGVFLKADGSVELTDDWDAGDYSITLQDLIIEDDRYIGTDTTPQAIQIESDGDLVLSGSIGLSDGKTIGVATTGPILTFDATQDQLELTLSDMYIDQSLYIGEQVYNAGINWTSRTAAEANTWRSVCYGNGLFVAVSYTGTNLVQTSPDGINWTSRTAAEANQWYSVCYGNGLFVAVSLDGTSRVQTSPDGINWTSRTAAEANQWYSICYGNGLFVAVSNTGTYRVQTSGKQKINIIPPNNIYQGEHTFTSDATFTKNILMDTDKYINFDGAQIYGNSNDLYIKAGSSGVTRIYDGSSNECIKCDEGQMIFNRLGADVVAFFTATPDSKATLGVSIDQQGNDDIILALQDGTDVSQPFTDFAAADTYGSFQKYAAATGGLEIRGFSEDVEGAVGLSLQGYVPITIYEPKAAVVIEGFKSDESTGKATVDNDQYVLGVYNNNVGLLRLLGDGWAQFGDSSLTDDIRCTFINSDNNGFFTWKATEDYFEFNDEILMNTSEKINLRDTAIGIYSQTDGYGDLFADTGWRIGDSSAGAPTNYGKFASDGSYSMYGTARIDWRKITANSVTLSNGTSSSSVSDLQTAHDGNFYHIDEAATTPGLRLQVTFTSVTAFNWVNITAVYAGSTTHSIGVQLRNFDNDEWDTFHACQTGIGDVSTSDGYIVGDYSFFVPNDSPYIGFCGAEEDEVWVRFNHTMAGNASHDLDIDVVALYQ